MGQGLFSSGTLEGHRPIVAKVCHEVAVVTAVLVHLHDTQSSLDRRSASTPRFQVIGWTETCGMTPRSSLWCLHTTGHALVRRQRLRASFSQSLGDLCSLGTETTLTSRCPCMPWRHRQPEQRGQFRVWRSRPRRCLWVTSTSVHRTAQLLLREHPVASSALRPPLSRAIAHHSSRTDSSCQSELQCVALHTESRGTHGERS